MKDIVGYEGLYTFDGENVRSVARQGTSGKVLKWFYNLDGRPYVNLCKDGQLTSFRKHQLVWMDYHQQTIPSGFEIHHIDGDFSNNNPRNLQLLTREEHQRLHDQFQKNNSRSKAVNCFKDGKLLGTFQSANEAARELGLRQGNISNCCNGRYNHTRGYQFSWA